MLRLEGSGSLYERTYRALRREILAGRRPAGSKLPSTRVLAADLGISRTTALLAYDQLLAEGYIEGREGSGTYVGSALPDPVLPGRSHAGDGRLPARPAAPRLSAYGRRIVARPPRAAPSDTWHGHTIQYDFRYGTTGTHIPERFWRRLVTRRLRKEPSEAEPTTLRTEFFIRYGRPEGYAPLRRAVADYLERVRAVACTPEQIVIVNGSQQALDLIARVLIDPGDTVVIEEPHAQGAREVFLAAGARLIPAPVDRNGLDPSALPRAARQARLAYVTPSHQFPTGAVMSLARRLALLRWASAARAYVLEHDYDGEYRYEGRPIEAVQALDREGRVIYVGTFSRVLFPALRLGYMVVPAPLVAPVRAAKHLTDRYTAGLSQEVVADLIASGQFERALRRARKQFASRRATLVAALEEHLGRRVAIEGENAGTHVMVRLRDVAARAVPGIVQRAAAAGVGIYPASPYYLRPRGTRRSFWTMPR